MRLKLNAALPFITSFFGYQLEDSQLWDWNDVFLHWREWVGVYQLEDSQLWDWNDITNERIIRADKSYQLEDSQLWDWNASLIANGELPYIFYQLEDSQLWDWNLRKCILLGGRCDLPIRRISIMRLKLMWNVMGRLAQRAAYQLEESQLWDWNLGYARRYGAGQYPYQLEESQLWDWNQNQARLPFHREATTN